MSVLTTYEVHLGDEDTGRYLSCLVLPPPDVVANDPIGALGFEPSQQVPYPSDLSVAVLSILLGDDSHVAAALYNDMHRNEFWDERGEELHPILSFSEYAAFAPGVHRGSSPAPPFSTYRRLVLAPAGSERPTGRRCPFTAAGSAGASANA